MKVPQPGSIEIRMQMQPTVEEVSSHRDLAQGDVADGGTLGGQRLVDCAQQGLLALI